MIPITITPPAAAAVCSGTLVSDGAITFPWGPISPPTTETGSGTQYHFELSPNLLHYLKVTVRIHGREIYPRTGEINPFDDTTTLELLEDAATTPYNYLADFSRVLTTYDSDGVAIAILEETQDILSVEAVVSLPHGPILCNHSGVLVCNASGSLLWN